MPTASWGRPFHRRPRNSRQGARRISDEEPRPRFDGARDVALALYDAAIAAAAPGPATAHAIEALRLERNRRVWVFAFGKAAEAMAFAAVECLLRSLHSIVFGVMVTPETASAPYPTIVAMRGDHPVPGKASLAAAAKIAEIAPGRRGTDVALVLVSGGTSSQIGRAH